MYTPAQLALSAGGPPAPIEPHPAALIAALVIGVTACFVAGPLLVYSALVIS